MKVFDKIKDFCKNKKGLLLLALSYILIIFLRVAVTFNYPIQPMMAGQDDWLMVKMAENIIDGKWLGTYSFHTLMKGPVFPLFLAAIYNLKISYIQTVTWIYVLSCLVFVFSFRKDQINKYFRLILFSFLVFNPIMMTTEVFQRVYRNSLIPSFSLLIPAGFMSIFNRRNCKTRYVVLFGLLNTIMFPLFYYTREDSIWLVPCVMFMIGIISLAFLIDIKKHRYMVIPKILLVILPIVSLSLFGKGLGKINEKYYGKNIRLVLSDGQFAKAMQQIYKVKVNEEYDRVNMTREKAIRLTAVSQEFSKIFDPLCGLLIGYNEFDANPNDGELEDGWLLWALRGAAQDSGITTLEEDEQFWGTMAHEINTALVDGRLESQPTLPSALMSPFRVSYIPKFFESVFESITFSGTFKHVEATDCIEYNYANDKKWVDRFIRLTNDKVVIDDKTQKEYSEDLMNSWRIRSSIINVISNIYGYLFLEMFVIALIYYIVYSIKLLIELLKKKFDKLEKWINMTCLLLAFATLIGGIAYNNTCTADSIKILYLCAGYPLMIAFSLIGVNDTIKYLKNIKNNKSTNS